jgi:RNA polymerase sigma factor (TIGR02999 family)
MEMQVGMPDPREPSSTFDITTVLEELGRREAGASERLLPLVYRELRQLAAWKLAREKPGQTLDATGLVHEAYLRVAASRPQTAWDNRRHFFAAAAEAMRRILVDNARRKQRLRHGGDMQRIDLDDFPIEIQVPHDDILSVHEALDKLAAIDEQAAKIVKLHYFTGLTLLEAAEVLGVSERTVMRDWAFARAWLRRRLDAESRGMSSKNGVDEPL